MRRVWRDNVTPWHAAEFARFPRDSIHFGEYDKCKWIPRALIERARVRKQVATHQGAEWFESHSQIVWCSPVWCECESTCHRGASVLCMWLRAVDVANSTRERLTNVRVSCEFPFLTESVSYCVGPWRVRQPPFSVLCMHTAQDTRTGQRRTRPTQTAKLNGPQREQMTWREERIAKYENKNRQICICILTQFISMNGNAYEQVGLHPPSQNRVLSNLVSKQSPSHRNAEKLPRERRRFQTNFHHAPASTLRPSAASVLTVCPLLRAPPCIGMLPECRYISCGRQWHRRPQHQRCQQLSTSPSPLCERFAYLTIFFFCSVVPRTHHMGICSAQMIRLFHVQRACKNEWRKIIINMKLLATHRGNNNNNNNTINDWLVARSAPCGCSALPFRSHSLTHHFLIYSFIYLWLFITAYFHSPSSKALQRSSHLRAYVPCRSKSCRFVGVLKTKRDEKKSDTEAINPQFISYFKGHKVSYADIWKSDAGRRYTDRVILAHSAHSRKFRSRIFFPFQSAFSCSMRPGAEWIQLKTF